MKQLQLAVPFFFFLQLCFDRIAGFAQRSDRHILTTITRISPNGRYSFCTFLSKEPSEIDLDDNDDGWGSNSDSKPSIARQNIEKDIEAAQEDRDLFIPIFSLVALAGLFGAYGYEMLRLFLRGELYLPFIH